MNDKQNELLDAHLRFTLKSYKGKQLDKKIAFNIDFIFEHLNGKVNQLREFPKYDSIK